MKNRTAKRKSITALILITVLALAAWALSQQLALLFGGYSLLGNHTVVKVSSLEDAPCKVVQTTADGQLALVRLSRSPVGIWYISGERTGSPNSWAKLGWLSGEGSRYYDQIQGLNGATAVHQVYCGSNAIAPIKFLPGQIPENVTVNIQQQGEMFWIYIVSFDSDATGSFSPYDLLVENGCISGL